MKQHIHRFVNWMEHGPMILTIWFMPVLLSIAAIAAIINFRKDHMTTTALPRQSIFTRIRNAWKSRKKNPDWSRIEEPDVMMDNFTIIVFGMIESAFIAMAVYAFMTGQIEDVIARFLAMQNTDLSFEQLYAAFTAVIVILTNVLIMTIVAAFRAPDGNDIAKMLRDLDENTQERIVELENNLSERLDSIDKQI